MICDHCKEEFEPVIKRIDRRFCSDECALLFHHNSVLLLSRKTVEEFKEKLTITRFRKTKNSDVKLNVTSTVSYADKTMLGTWVGKAKLTRTYIPKKVWFFRNGYEVSRTINCLSLSLDDINKLINCAERHFKKTGNLIYRNSIKTLLGFKETWTLALVELNKKDIKSKKTKVSSMKQLNY